MDEKTQIRKCLCYHIQSKHDSFILNVYWNVNLLNSPDFDELVEEYILENYGDLQNWLYDWIDMTDELCCGYGWGRDGYWA